MAEAIRLTRPALEQLAAQWRKHDAPIARRLAPGLSDAEMDAITEPLQLRVPQEARGWWGWHNGAQDASIVTSGGKSFSSLERCVGLAQQMREIARDVSRPYHPSAAEADAMARGVWKWDWLPLSDDGVGGMLVIDAAVDAEQAEACPVWYRAIDYSTDEAVLVAPSIGTLVRQWTLALDVGTGSHNDRGDRWALDLETLPTDYDTRLL